MRSTSRAARRARSSWKIDPGTDRAWAGDVACCGVNNRGVALWKDKVISIALDGRMFAINKATGEKVWERKIADPALGETHDHGAAGHPRPRHRRRRRRRIRHPRLYRRDRPQHRQAGVAHLHDPGAGEPGNETWKDGKERWQHGGGSVWETATYDPRDRHDLPGHRQCRPRLRSGISARATTNGRRACSRSIRTTARSSGASSTRPNDPYDFDEISEHPIIDAKVNGEDRKLVVHAARNGFFYALDRTNGSFVAGKQYVDELNWTPGLDPKTGKPLNYDPKPRTCRSIRRAATARAASRWRKLCPSHMSAARTGSRPPTIRSSTCSTSRSIEGCNGIEHGRAEGLRADQGGTVKPRERFTGGAFKMTEPPLRQPQGGRSDHRRDQGRACSSTIRTTPARSRPPAIWCSSASRTARFSAYDAKTLQEALELQRRHRHQRAADQLCGERQAVRRGAGRLAAVADRHADDPELKNTSTASMLFVFAL